VVVVAMELDIDTVVVLKKGTVPALSRSLID